MLDIQKPMFLNSLLLVHQLGSFRWLAAPPKQGATTPNIPHAPIHPALCVCVCVCVCLHEVAERLVIPRLLRPNLVLDATLFVQATDHCF